MNAMRCALTLAAAAALVTNPQRSVRRLQAGDALDDVRFAGTRRLYGEAATTTLRDASAMVVGVGGVGSWAAEAIARTGVGRLILVDLDEVCVSNTNRQLVALTSTVGKSKVEVLRDRLTDINPNAVVECVPDFVGEENADAILGAAKVDVVVDCIDNANDKVALLRACDAREQAIVVCGAAGGRRDPTAVRVRPGDVRGARTGDALLRATRKQWRRARRAAGLDGEIREARVVSVYSDERPPAKAEVRTGACDMGLGSSVFATAAFGLAAGAAAVDVLIADGAVAAVEHDVLIAESAARDDTAGAARPIAAVLAGVDDGEDDAWEEADCPCSDFGLAARGRPRRTQWRGGSGGPPRVSRRRSTALGAVDTHCHAQFASEPPVSAAELVVCSTGPGDWDAVSALAPTAKAVAYGVHPWWACDASEGWLDALERRLVESPTALVGECGLDKFAGGRSPPGSGEPPDLELQDSIFRAQLALARELSRGVTVHCVKRVDAVAAAIRAERPPRVAFHGFNGSPESASVLIRAVEAGGGTAFFGINTAHASKKTPQLVAALPEESLLAESDASGEFEARVADATKLIADAREWSLTEAEERLAGNARAFLL
mgnify:FL=1